MVAQVTLDHSVWVRALVPEPKWRYGQAAKTSPSQGEITGSIPVSATTEKQSCTFVQLFFIWLSDKKRSVTHHRVTVL